MIYAELGAEVGVGLRMMVGLWLDAAAEGAF